MNIDFSRSVNIIGPINSDSAVHVFRETGKAIEKNADGETFLIINSGGGFVDIGNTIVDILPLQSPKLVTVGTGMVGSMAIPIFLCGRRRFIAKHTRFFFHEIGRNYKDTRLGVSEVEYQLGDMKAQQQWYINYVVERTGGKVTADCLRQWMKNETTLYPDDLKDLGFFEAIL